tara:strand:+ start:272 stop:520 length:249 start_codon:yes stop_codon:yes gene_type:complete
MKTKKELETDLQELREEMQLKYQADEAKSKELLEQMNNPENSREQLIQIGAEFTKHQQANLKAQKEFTDKYHQILNQLLKLK